MSQTRKMRRLQERVECEAKSLRYLVQDLLEAGYPMTADDVKGMALKLEFLEEQIALDIDEHIERMI